MKARCTLTLDYVSAAEAKIIFDATHPENEGYIDARLDGARITAVIEADTPKSLNHTVEDYLACVSVAEKSINQGK